MRRTLSAPTAGSPPRLLLVTCTMPLPESNTRTRFVTSIQRLPEPQSALITCQPGPGMTAAWFCAAADVENKRTAVRTQKKLKDIKRLFISLSFGPAPQQVASHKNVHGPWGCCAIKAWIDPGHRYRSALGNVTVPSVHLVCAHGELKVS